ncbi:MAG: mechanosensitive ion channel family protein [Brevundimonas sp.]|uniref:mechanosensitive ion channel family protein n=1 Tax=Brevundimonas sp. TaxID=1871086 RepID=UPI00391A9A20
MKVRLILALAFAWALGLASGPVAAQGASAGVRLDGREVMRVSGDSANQSANRARRVEARLSALTNSARIPQPARVVDIDSDEPRIEVGGQPVVTVTLMDAAEEATSQAALARQWAMSVDLALAEAREARRSPGGRYWAEARGSAEAALQRLGASTVSIVPRAAAALLVVLLFCMIASVLRFALRRALPLVVRDPTRQSLVRQMTYFGLVALGLVVAADVLGFSPGSVVAGLGLTGLVLGFALKDILSNFVSGLLILALRPFHIGDQIVIGESAEGTVERIELRATQIRTYDGRVTLVPNAEVFTSRITNNTADPVRRGNVRFRLGYEVDIQSLVALLPAGAAGVEGVLETPPPRLRVRTLDASDIEFDLAFWTDSRRSDFQDTGSLVRRRVVDLCREAGVGLPNPDIRLIQRLPDNPADRA